MRVSLGSPEARAEYERARRARDAYETSQAIDALHHAVRLDPAFASAHAMLIALTTQVQSRGDEADAARQKLHDFYAEWLTSAPENPALHWALAKTASDREQARRHYEQAVAVDPTFALAWYDLAYNADLRGDRRGKAECLRRASEEAPGNARYRIAYAQAVRDFEPALYRTASLEVAERFPGSLESGQALYWLGVRSLRREERIDYLERVLRDQAGTRSHWITGAARELVRIYADSDLPKALAIVRRVAKEVPPGEKMVDNLVKAVEAMSQATELLLARQFGPALLQLERVDRAFGFTESPLYVLRAQADTGLGYPERGYDRLLARIAEAPDVDLQAALLRQGALVGKSASRVEHDIWERRYHSSRLAPDFDLPNLADGSRSHLSAWRGSVVLLDFWFPT